MNRLAVPSTSVEVSVPPVVSTALVSVRFWVSTPAITAASLVAATVTVPTATGRLVIPPTKLTLSSRKLVLSPEVGLVPAKEIVLLAPAVTVKVKV